MKRNRAVWGLLTVLLGVFMAINTSTVWKWMYPIKYQQEIKQASQRYAVDPHLVLAIIRAESDFDPTRVSKKGALGLMQVMPDTASWVLSQADFADASMDNITHPKVNIDVGTWYLSFLLKKFAGDTVLAVAAYNAGPGNVTAWLARSQWNGSSDTIADIPIGETRHYVQRVLYFHQRYNQVYSDQLE